MEHPLQLAALGVNTSMVSFAEAMSAASARALESGEKNASTTARPRHGAVNRGSYARVCCAEKFAAKVSYATMRGTPAREEDAIASPARA